MQPPRGVSIVGATVDHDQIGFLPAPTSHPSSGTMTLSRVSQQARHSSVARLVGERVRTADVSFVGDLPPDRPSDRPLGAPDARLGVQIDTEGARRLNCSSPSCLNSRARRTDFLHGLLDVVEIEIPDEVGPGGGPVGEDHQPPPGQRLRRLRKASLHAI